MRKRRCRFEVALFALAAIVGAARADDVIMSGEEGRAGCMDFSPASGWWGCYPGGRLTTEKTFQGRESYLLETRDANVAAIREVSSERLDGKRALNVRVAVCVEDLECGRLFPTYFIIRYKDGETQYKTGTWLTPDTAKPYLGNWHVFTSRVDLSKRPVEKLVYMFLLNGDGEGQKASGRVYIDELEITTEDAKQASTTPLLTAPRAASPKIDGVLDEAEWRYSAEASNFRKQHGGDYSTEKTCVRMMHDGVNLYVGVRMDDFALNPGSNNTSGFKASQKGRGAYAWLDDSFELRLVAPGMNLARGEALYFGFNSICGTHFIVPKGYPKDGDKDIRLKCTCSEKGYWAAEFSVPLALLRNGADEAVLPDCKISFVRHQPHLDESTCWPYPTENEQREQDKFMADLRLGDTQTPGMTVPAYASFLESPEFPVAARVETDYSVYGAYTLADGGLHQVGVREKIAPGARSLKMDYPASGKKTRSYQCRLFADGKVFCISPEIPLQQNDGNFILSCDVPQAEFVWNGKPRKYAQAMMLFPQGNSNALEVRKFRNGGRIRLDLEGFPGGGLPYDRHWEVLDGKGDSTLVEASADGTVRHGDASTLTLRKTLWYKPIPFLSSQGDRKDFVATADAAYLFRWQPMKNKARTLAEPHEKVKLHLFLPLGVTLVDASSRIRYPEGYKPYSFPPEHNMYGIVGSVPCPGGEYVHWIVERTEPLTKIKMFPEHQNNRETCNVTLRFAPELAGKTVDLYHFSEQDGGLYSTMPEKVSCRVLPKLNGIQPRNATVFFFAWYDFNDIATKTGNDAFLDTMRQAGINTVFADNRNCDPDAFGIKLASFFYANAEEKHWMHGSLGQKAIFDKYPEARNKTWLTRHPEAHQMLDELFGGIRRNYPKLTMQFFDYEFSPLKEDNVYRDFSDHAMEIFRSDYGIAERLTAQEAIWKYPDQWCDFCCRETAAQAALFARYARKHGFQFCVYCGYQCPKSPKSYGIDWRYLAPGKIDIAGCGYGRSQKEIDDTHAALAGTPVFFGVLGETPPSTLVRRVVDSRGGGLLVWHQYGWSGKDLQDIATATRFIARYEDFFSKGRPVSLPALTGIAADRCAALELDGRKLYVVFNESSTSVMNGSIVLPDGEFTDCEDGTPCRGIRSVRLQPGAFAAFVQK